MKEEDESKYLFVFIFGTQIEAFFLRMSIHCCG